MNKYTRALHFKNGQSILITDEEMLKISAMIEQGLRFVKVQGEMISVDTIARIGSHHATADLQKRNESDVQRALENGGKSALADARRELIKNKAISNVLGIEKETVKKLTGWDMDEKMLETNKKLAMSEEESENGEPDYYSLIIA